jgi:hypothetical protein
MSRAELGGPFLPGLGVEETGGDKVLFDLVKLIGAPGGIVERLDQGRAVRGIPQAV